MEPCMNSLYITNCGTCKGQLEHIERITNCGFRGGGSKIKESPSTILFLFPGKNEGNTSNVDGL